MSKDFQRILSHSDGYELRITVSTPRRENDENADWQCEYKIDGFGIPKIRTAVGIDSIQAITLALTYISTTLYFSDEYKNGKISWEGGLSLFDLGLPMADNVREDIYRLRETVQRLHGSR